MKRSIFLVVLLFFVVAIIGQTTPGGGPVKAGITYDDSASTPVISAYVRHDTVPDRVMPTDQSWWINNMKEGDRLVVLIQRYKKKGNHVNNRFYAIDDHCTGTNDTVYKCIVPHTSKALSKPITGAQYLTYWVVVPNNKLDSIRYILKDTSLVQDIDANIKIDYRKKGHNYDSIP